LFGSIGKGPSGDGSFIDGDRSAGRTGENDFSIGGCEFIIGAREFFEPDARGSSGEFGGGCGYEYDL
jgi:hypothetical protein